MSFTVIPPYAIYTDREGNPLDNGYIYIGTANQNPQTNPITVYWDAAGTIPATQPIRTMSGFAWRNGSPANIYTNAVTYSIVVRNSNGTLVSSSLSTPSEINYSVLSASSGSSLVGFIQAESGAVATTVQGKLRAIQKSTSDYATFPDYTAAAIQDLQFTQSGAVIQRLADRAFVGAACANDGAFPNVYQDWLSAYQVAAGLGAGLVVSSTFASVTEEAVGAACGGTFGAQSLASVSAATSCIGLASFAVNNNATLATNAWGLYVEAHKENAVAGVAFAVETNTRSLVATTTPTPWQQGNAIGYQVAAGCGLSAVGQFDCSAAIQIVANPMQWKVGINFMHDSISGTDGTSGYGEAIAFGAYQGISWYNSSGATVGRITTTHTTAADFSQLRFTSLGPAFLGATGQVLFAAFPVASAVNYLAATPAIATQPPLIASVGTDADIDLRLVPKGTGVVQFGTKTGTGDVAIDGYVTIKDNAGNVVKLATVA